MSPLLPSEENEIKAINLRPAIAEAKYDSKAAMISSIAKLQTGFRSFLWCEGKDLKF